MNEDTDATEKAEGPGQGDQPSSFPPANRNETREFGLGTLAKTLGESGFCIWIVVDLVRDPGLAWWLKFLLWLAASLALFDIAHTVYSKFWPKRSWVFALYAVLSLGFLIIGLGRNPPAEPQPNFVLSLQVGDSNSPSVFLTNDFLFSSHGFMRRESTNGPMLFKGYSQGCIVIPVKPGETNKVFRFTADNQSDIMYRDLEVAIAFPNDWKCSADPKWEPVDEIYFYMPGWKVTFTNLQVWAAQTSKVLYGWESLRFPSITNASIETYSGPHTRGGQVLIMMRSTNLYGCMGANIVFFPSTDEQPFNPFVAATEFDSNGLLQVIVPRGAGQ